MFSFHRLYIEAHVRGASDQDLGAAIDALLGDYRGPAAIFVVLLQWAERRFGEQPGWAELAPMAKVAVVWTYADCVTDILCSLALDLPATAQVLSQRTPQRRITEILTLVHGLDDSVFDPAAIHAEPLLIAGLEFGLGDRFSDLEPTEARLELFAGYFGATLPDGQTVSRPMRAMQDVENPYPTWLSRAPADYGPFGSTLQGDAFVVSSVEALANDPTELHSWLYLVVWGTPSLPAKATVQLREVLAKLDIGQFVGAQGILVLRAVAEVASRLAGEEACSGLLEKMLAYADWQTREDAAAGRSSDPWFSALLEAAATASRSYAPGRGMERFCQFCVALMAIAPETAVTLRSVFDGAVDQTPIAQSLDLWRALLVGRAT